MTSTAIDPRKLLDSSPMSTLQIIVVAITVFLNALDGFDVLSISFASPGIAEEWGTTQAGLGIVLSMELIGMAIGSVLLGGVADKIGRRNTLLGCLMVMSLGMVMVPGTGNTVELSIWRVFTGLGIGGMLACTNAVTAEFANARRRALCISLMVIGYPLGGVFGGMIASNLLASYDWRAVFYFGAAVTAFLIPVVYFLVPESIQWLTRKQPEGALEKINGILIRLKHSTVSALPVISSEERKKSVAEIFKPGLIAITLMITAAYFLHVTTFYFILKWTPKIVADMGFLPSLAGGVLVWANVGGALGGAIFGLLTTRFELRKLTIAILVLTAVGVAIFGRTPEDLDRMKMLAAFAGFFGNAGITGLYSIMANAFPTHVRATGTGFAIGVGRGGAVLSPILAGFLLDGGSSLPTVGLIMGMGSLLAGIVLIFLKLGTGRSAGAQAAQPDDSFKTSMA
ncbi:MAG: MFS transporter [Pseudomonadales bacterium]|nr:MFS transporter [Pseudomonadales bacterium]